MAKCIEGEEAKLESSVKENLIELEKSEGPGEMKLEKLEHVTE